jgi:hypothetical protein
MYISILNSIFIIVIIIVVVSFSLFFVIRKSKKDFIQRELSDIISKCTKIESGLERGFARFEPINEEKYLYDMLVSSGVMRVNPLGGYSFTSNTSKALDLVEGKEVIKVNDYSPPTDNVLASGKDKDGKVIPLIIEKDGKPINAQTGEVVKPGFGASPKG